MARSSSAPKSDASDHVPADISREQQLSNLKDRDDAFKSASAAMRQMQRYLQSELNLVAYKLAAIDRDGVSAAELETADRMEQLRK